MPKPDFVSFILTFEGIEVECQASYSEEGNGKPLLMLHGFFGERKCWQPLSREIKENFRCISLDLLGFGESAKPEFSHFVAAQVTFINQFLKKLELKRCYIIGHSFGAWVASKYALNFPDCVNGLILLGPAGIKDNRFEERYFFLRPLLWETPLIDWSLNLVTPLSEIFNYKKALETIKEYRYQLTNQPVARSMLITRLQGMRGAETVETEIHKLKIPVLVIAGECDETIPLWHSETYAREIPNAQLEIIPGADHALPTEYPQKIAASILKFFVSESTV
ncbi:MAG: alpha/beta hydrolase [Xenococcaceae cyanobacterium MO_207.B15]|nr:alpha/beta hydrolase [Xenococcaceae cyanobacterium MO_207.B15]